MVKTKKSLTRKGDPLAHQIAHLKKQLNDTHSLWQSKYNVLKGQIHSKIEVVAEDSFAKGYAAALADQISLDEAFDKFMENAAAQFEKKYLKKAKASSHIKRKSKAKKRKK